MSDVLLIAFTDTVLLSALEQTHCALVVHVILVRD